MVGLATIGDMVRQVRHTLQDTESESYRYTDQRIIDAMNLGILDMRRRRPDFFIGRYNEPTFQAGDLTDVYDLPDITIPMIIKYATAHVEMAENEYTSDGRAAALMTMFDNDLTKR